MTATKYLSVIDKDGKVAKGKDPNLDAEELRRLYRVMVTTRVMDERALVLQRQGRIGFYVPATGQEASHIGSAYALRDSDWIFPSYRQPGIPLLRGAKIDHLIAEWYGYEGDICKGRQMPVHYSLRSIHFVSVSSPIGTQISHAAGCAMAMRMRKHDGVAMTYFGDGATSSNDFHSGLNFAAVYRAPVVFVCENNHWAISVPVSAQSGTEEMAVKAEAYGMPGVRVDGNDVLAVYRVCKEAVERARRGEGPTLVETVTFRMGPHSSSDDPSKYRDAATVEQWKRRDPIQRFQRYLQQRRLWNEAFEKECQESARATINEAIKRVEATNKPAPRTMFEDVYMTMPPHLQEQMQDLLSLEGPAAADEGAFPL
ncbi:MAG: pyruvate dehydrogenase (acetyl-transferring) E1 component subunit alpha [Planctomycetes bacterium]|nr:pyruvate dehydrogenase (acetyl-transferring) E1 component subunit alpha [Planctomycetota bacterium]